MVEKAKSLLSNRTNVVLVSILAVILVGALWGGVRLVSRPAERKMLEEVDLPFAAEGPYAMLLPRKDGNALNLSIRRVSSYNAISYDLTYQSEGIDRGVHGDIKKYGEMGNKGEYAQEILFGTCSKGDTTSTLHCVFDKNVENGTLILFIEDDTKRYRMNTSWHLQKPDVALGMITSADGHFVYKTDAARDQLVMVAYTIVNDLSGVPKLPIGKLVVGKVYAFNVPIARSFPAGEVTIEQIDKPPAGAKIGRYNEGKNSWEMLDTKVEGSKLSAKVDGEGIFAVLGDGK